MIDSESGGVPREQVLKGHLPRVIYYQVRWYTKKEHISQSGPESGPGFGHFQVNVIESFSFRSAAAAPTNVRTFKSSRGRSRALG